ncbi:hypothetical protein [Ferrovibrio sp.]|uniref:hypothetical protein n=1 Tax=Ferrovibrio sp. TaxID=1917215 RepID=UPI0035AFC38D
MRLNSLYAVLLLALLLPCMAAAQSLHGALDWLPRGSLNLHDLTTRPAETLSGGEAQSFYSEFGRLAFRSPDILGGNARKAGLSCQACHANGHVSSGFFIPGLSKQPGEVDLSNALWHARAENHRFDPQKIPSLRGVLARPRFGFDQRSGSLREFTREVIVMEFAGAEPDALLLDALVAYMRLLQPTDMPDSAITLRSELAELARFSRLLILPLAEEDAALSARITGMLRGQIGFMHERFDQAGPRTILEQWSLNLRDIATLAEAGEWTEARRRRAALTAALLAPPQMLLEAENASLYAPDRLAAWLKRR